VLLDSTTLPTALCIGCQVASFTLLENAMVIGIIIGWIVIGLIVGFIAGKVVNLHGDDPRLGTGVACGGAVIAAALYSVISGAGMSAWHPMVLLSAAIGAAVAAVVWHMVRSRFVSREAYTTRQSY
jgi:uncharacterized membrane protein YeaQ/YmgE (transglycosylase-associated protein family)